MIRRFSLIGLALLILAFGSAGAGATAPPGPRLAATKLVYGGGTALLAFDALGEQRRSLYAAAPGTVPSVPPVSPPSWSPDGKWAAFTATVGQKSERFATYPIYKIYRVGEDGGEVTPVAGTVRGALPVVSPDGQRIAFAKERRRWRRNARGGVEQVYGSVSIWIVSSAGGQARQLTPWRNRLRQLPSSFSPDGSRLAYTRYVADKPPEALAMEFNGSADTVLAQDASEPVYSPDGRSIAFLRGPLRAARPRGDGASSSVLALLPVRVTDIYVRSADGGSLRQLTSTKGVVERAPRWDPSSSRLSFVEGKAFPSSTRLGLDQVIREINPDGSCSTVVLRPDWRGAVTGAAWQPGPGREAGPISC